jgi:hypothetical protein
MKKKPFSKTPMKKISLTALVLCCSLCAFSQREEESTSPDKFFAGGNFGLSLGRYTLINLSPQVGYRFNRFLGGGIGMNLVYASQKEKYNGADYSKTTQGITGLNVFARFYPIQKFMIQVQPEANYIFGNIKYYNPPAKYKIDAEIIPSVLVGGGLVTPTARGAMLLTVMYDVLQNPDAPYGNRPIVNVGYNFNF